MKKAVILAAGMGTRMASTGQSIPKSLMVVGTQTILDWQLSALQERGVSQIAVVTGYLADQVSQAAGSRATCVQNPRYRETNNIYSLWCARHWVDGDPFVVLHADLVFHPTVLARLLEAREDSAVAVDSRLNDETMRVAAADGRLTDIRKGIPQPPAVGVLIGMAKFGRLGCRALFEALEKEIIEGRLDRYFTEGVVAMARQGMPVGIVWVDGLPWIEVDIPQELVQAQEVIKQCR